MRLGGGNIVAADTRGYECLAVTKDKIIYTERKIILGKYTCKEVASFPLTTVRGSTGVFLLLGVQVELSFVNFLDSLIALTCSNNSLMSSRGGTSKKESQVCD